LIVFAFCAIAICEPPNPASIITDKKYLFMFIFLCA
jgi:hypothetical protein